MLQLLNQQTKVLTRKVKEIVENNTEQKRISNANLEAAKLKSLRETTLKYVQDTVKKGVIIEIIYNKKNNKNRKIIIK